MPNVQRRKEPSLGGRSVELNVLEEAVYQRIERERVRQLSYEMCPIAQGENNLLEPSSTHLSGI